MAHFCTEAYDCFRRRFWQDEGRGPGNLLALKCLRVLVLAGRGLIRNQSLVRSSALAYATILGFIPLFALLFAILQAIGVPRFLSTYLLENLAPGSRDFATQILQYIEATKVTSLGVFGVVVLLLDLVIVMTNVEKAFNKTWQVSRTRSWNRKVSDYLSIFLIFPIMMAVALTFSTSFWGLRYVIEILSGILPAIFFTATRWLVSLGLLWFAFIFIYLVMPNTRVSFWSAVLGGMVGAPSGSWPSGFSPASRGPPRTTTPFMAPFTTCSFCSSGFSGAGSSCCSAPRSPTPIRTWTVSLVNTGGPRRRRSRWMTISAWPPW